jgi:hypothetical protein
LVAWINRGTVAYSHFVSLMLKHPNH